MEQFAERMVLLSNLNRNMEGQAGQSEQYITSERGALVYIKTTSFAPFSIILLLRDPTTHLRRTGKLANTHGKIV